MNILMSWDQKVNLNSDLNDLIDSCNSFAVELVVILSLPQIYESIIDCTENLFRFNLA